jgi:hypothetical protein
LNVKRNRTRYEIYAFTLDTRALSLKTHETNDKAQLQSGEVALPQVIDVYAGR